MKIDRHNYEELFLLYVDNELSASQRRQVEEFAARNPDLKEELEILSRHKLVPDGEVRFPNNESLYRESELASPDMNNYQGWLLLYVDRELTAEQLRKFEAFLKSHPRIAAEAQLALRTRLSPEKISFPDKETLYRHPVPVRRIAPVWRRAAAAAILLLLGGASFLLLTRTRPGPKDEVAKSTVQPGIAPEKRVQIVEQPQAPAIQQPQHKHDVPKPAQRGEPTEVRIAETAVTEESIAVYRSQDNELPVPVDNPNLKVTESSSPLNRIEEVLTPTVSNDVVTNNNAQPSNFMTASFTEESEQSDGRKNKLRGLLRKVTRTFEKTTQVKATDENETLLVGGLAIKLK